MFFNDVQIVTPEFQIPSENCISAIVSLSAISYKTDKIRSAYGTAKRNFGIMTWSFAMKKPNADQFLYSFTSSSTGTQPFTTKKEGPDAFGSTLEVAINQLLKGFVDKKIGKSLLNSMLDQ